MPAPRIRMSSLLMVLALGAAGLPGVRAVAADAPAGADAKPAAQPKDKAGEDKADDDQDDKKASDTSQFAQLRPATAADLSPEMAQLLTGVQGNAVMDAVWRFMPSKTLGKGAGTGGMPGNVLVVVPVVLGKGPYKAGDPPVNPGLGRFIAWYLPVSETKDGAAILPLGAPKVASGFAVVNGEIHWALERFARTMDLAPGGTLADARSWYLFAVDRNRLKALAPPSSYKKGPPFVHLPKLGKFEPADKYRERDMAAKAAHDARETEARRLYDAKKVEYAAVAEKVAALPDKFSAPAPGVVYAVYYAPEPPQVNYNAPKARPQEISYTGFPEGTWKPSRVAWDALVTLAKGTGTPPVGDARKAAEAQMAVVATEIETSRAHPLALRAASAALAASGLLNDLQPEAPAFLVADKVLASSDGPARGQVMRSLTVANNSSAKAKLLARAVAVNDSAGGDRALADDLRLSALRVLLHAKETDTDAKRAEAVNKALADAGGAAPKGILDTLRAAVEGADAVGGAMTLERAKTFASLLRFQDIADAKRQGEALSAVAGAAGDSLLAAVVADEVMRAVPQKALEAAAHAGRIPLYHDQHALLERLSDKDPAVRAAAWKALPAFRLATLGDKTDGRDARQASLPGVLARIVDAGLAIKPVPEELTPFLAAQAEDPALRPAAVTGLARVWADGGEAAAKQASASLAKPTLVSALAPAMLGLDAEVRWRAVAGAYGARGQAMPITAGLLLADKVSDAAVRWFVDEFSKGKLPLPVQYADLAKDKVALMDFVMGQEPRLAGAAVAVLAYQEGASDAQAAATADKMLAEPYKLRAQMERKWEACRNELFMARVKASEGEREVRLAVCRRGEKAWREGPVKQVLLKWQDDAMATGIPGVLFQVDADKKVILLSDAALLDRVNPKMRHELELGELTGQVELSWKAPCWEAKLRPDADTEVLVRLAPVGWGNLPALPEFVEKK